MKFLNLLLFFCFGLVNSKCVNINTPEITKKLNVTYDSECFNHVKGQYECCSHFMLDDRCIDDYKECSKYKEFILNGLKHECDGHNKNIMNLTYSDKCHDFTLSLKPYCCDNMSLPECSDWYTDCHLHSAGHHDEVNCSIPTKYNNQH